MRLFARTQMAGLFVCFFLAVCWSSHTLADPPVFVSTPLTTATEDILYTYLVVVRDAPNNDPSVLLNKAPEGMTISATSFVGPAGCNPCDWRATVGFRPGNSQSDQEFLVELVATDIHNESATQAYQLYVTNINDPPIAEDDTASTQEDIPVDIDVLANDSDPDPSDLALTVQIHTVPLHGTAVVHTNQSIGYTPESNFNGTDTFSYDAQDVSGAQDTALVVVTIAAVNDAPVWVSPTPEGTVVSENGADITFRIAAEDVDSHEVFYGGIYLPKNAILDEDTGDFFWTPPFGAGGVHPITITATDTLLTNTRNLLLDVQFVDQDQDNVPDTLETQLGLNTMLVDSDNDTISDQDEIGDLDNPSDIDQDHVLDALDTDSDNDEMLDAWEAGDNDVLTPPIDSDNDGLYDFRDVDSDNDGILDTTDNCRVIPNAAQQDHDNNGLGDVCETDSDQDGILDPFDTCPNDPAPGSSDGCPTQSGGCSCDGFGMQLGVAWIFVCVACVRLFGRKVKIRMRT